MMWVPGMERAGRVMHAGHEACLHAFQAKGFSLAST